MKKLFFALVALVVSLYVNAQSIECSKIGTSQAADLEENQAAVTFISSQGNWVIKPVAKKGVNDQAMGRTAIDNGNKYSYEFRADVARDHERTFIISKQGSPMSEQVVAKGLRSGMRVTYELKEVADTLERIEIQETGAKGVYPKDGFACVEITTTVKGLDVNTSWSTTEEQTDAGARRINVEVNVEQLRTAKLRMDSLASVIERMENQGDYLNIDDVAKQFEAQKQWYDSRSTIILAGTAIKALPLSLTDLSQKEKRRYAVVALKMSECASMLEEAERLFSSMKYDDAKRVYNSALKAKDVTDDLKPAIMSNISRCDSCIQYFQRLVGVLGLINKKKESGNINQYDVASYYNAAIEYMQILYRYNPNDYYKKNISSLENTVKDMPFIIRFTVARWVSDRVNVYEDGAFSGVEVWAYYGVGNPKPADFSDANKFDKMVTASPQRYNRVGITDAEGVVDMELRRSSLPTGFFFKAINKNIKTDIAYRNMEEVLSQAKNEYNKRQFRLKMYIKK